MIRSVACSEDATENRNMFQEIQEYWEKVRSNHAIKIRNNILMAQKSRGTFIQGCKQKLFCKRGGLLLPSFSRHEGKSGLVRNENLMKELFKGNRGSGVRIRNKNLIRELSKGNRRSEVRVRSKNLIRKSSKGEQGIRGYYMYPDMAMTKIIAPHTRSPLRACVTPCWGQGSHCAFDLSQEFLLFRSALCAPLNLRS